MYTSPPIPVQIQLAKQMAQLLSRMMTEGRDAGPARENQELLARVPLGAQGNVDPGRAISAAMCHMGC
jgi:hypothetical protein